MSNSDPKAARGGRRLISLGLAAALAGGTLTLVAPQARAATAETVAGGSISWGLKASFRSYVTGPIAHGAITPSAPATDDGTQTTFAQAAGTWADDDATVGTKGSVNFSGHDGVLDLTLSEPAIVVDGDSATLVVDAVDSDDNTYADLAIANLDLAGAVSRSGNTVTISDAPATLTAAGTAVFSFNGNPMYPAGTVLDPVDAVLTIQAPSSVSASRTTFGDAEVATVTVTGSGFNPADAIATRPPLNGRPAGVYVVVGKFAENWRPSQGAASTTRKSASTKWAVLAEDMAKIGGPAAGAIELEPDGSFTAELIVDKAALDSISGLDASHVNYGIYTYAGGGATKADWEHYTPISFVAPTTTTTTLSAPATTYGKAAKVTATVSPAGTGTVALTGAGGGLTAALSGGKATFTLPANLAAGTHKLTASYSGDATHDGSAATATLTVGKASTKTSLAVRSSTYGKPATVAVTVSGGASGQVRLTGAGSAITANVTAGKATLTLPRTLDPAKRKLTATYLPDGNHLGSSASVTHSIGKAKVSRKLAVSRKPTTKATGRVTVSVAGVAGAKLPTGTVKLRIKKGGKTYYVSGKLASGTRKLTIRKLAKGTWSIAVRYSGDKRYSAAGYYTLTRVKVTR